MPLEKFSVLNPDRKALVRSLAAHCCAADGTSLSFPEEDAELYLLYYAENGCLLSAAAFSPEEGGGYDCSAFTRPEFRNRGLFSLLLDTAEELLPEESDFFFYVDEHSSDTVKALHALGADLLSREHMMERPAGNTESLPAPLAAVRSLCGSTESGRPVFLYSCPYGSLTIAEYGDSYYLYGFEIQHRHRGRGYGKSFLSGVLSDLSRLSSRPVRLQVSGDNLPALTLYEKTGFLITETLSRYLY